MNLFDKLYPPPLRQREDALVEARREAVRQAGHDDRPADTPRWGLAFSGGGIRSATFCLGVVQSLVRMRRLTRFDYLSTVSGGGFLGGFLGALLQRAETLQPPATAVSALDYVHEQLDDDRSSVMEWLRENGRYLTPNGAADSWYAVGTMLRNWMAVHLVVAGALLLLMFLAQVGRAAAVALAPGWMTLETLRIGGLWLSPWLPSTLVIVAIWLIPAAWAYWLTQRVPGFSLPPFVGIIGVFALGLRLSIRYQAPASPPPAGQLFPWLFSILALTSGLALLYWAVGIFRGCRAGPDHTIRDSRASADQVRRMRREAAAGFALMMLATLLVLGSVLDVGEGTWPQVAPTWIYLTAFALALGGGLLLTVATGSDERHELRQLIRERLSRSAGISLLVTVLILALGAIDSAAQSIYVWACLNSGFNGRWVAGALASAISIGSVLAPWASRFAARARSSPRTSLRLAAVTAALVLGLGYLLMLAVVTYAVRWGGAFPNLSTTPDQPIRSVAELLAAVREQGVPQPFSPYFRLWFLWWLMGLAGLTLLMRRLFGFVNISSHHDFYAARLTRAYLGISNFQRWRGGQQWPVTRPIAGDNLSMDEYQPHTRGGPLHLINVTLNETVSGRSQTEQRDRKGLAMAVGPAGVSVSSSHHALWHAGASGQGGAAPRTLHATPRGNASFYVWQADTSSDGTLAPIRCESLSLGYWMAVSGAAFSTSLGSRTSMATSLLAGLFNVRLGYWWDSGVQPSWRPSDAKTPLTGSGQLASVMARLLPVQVALLDEFLGRFHGPARQRWQLSDGGHFENTACFELIRRRVPVIVACDCGRDPDCYHEDLANLARKVRVDFGAEITFLTHHQIALVLPGHEDYLGPIESLVPRTPAGGTARRSRAHAAIAAVWHAEREQMSWLLLLKPGMTGDEPVDLEEYQTSHPSFPHESTTDQFFDEAQWESYRKLGAHTGERVLTRFMEVDLVQAEATLRALVP